MYITGNNNDLTEIQKLFNDELKTLDRWFNSIKLAINTDKTKYVLISLKKRKSMCNLLMDIADFMYDVFLMLWCMDTVSELIFMIHKLPRIYQNMAHKIKSTKDLKLVIARSKNEDNTGNYEEDQETELEAVVEQLRGELQKKEEKRQKKKKNLRRRLLIKAKRAAARSTRYQR